jgi:hypothetical protein
MRTYVGPDANQLFQMDARLFAEYGFHPVSQSGLVTTTGPGMGSILALGIMAFGQRTTSSSISVLFQRRQPAPAVVVQPPAPSITDQIRALGELRDAELITAEEYEAKKVELLDRM